MRHVDFDPSRLRGEDATWWQQWSARADAESRSCGEARRSGQATQLRLVTSCRS